MKTHGRIFWRNTTVWVCALALAAVSCDDDDRKGGETHPVPVSGIEVSPTELSLAPGETRKLQVKVIPEDADDRSYSWTSDDPAVADVENDVVTARAAGNATLTVTSADGGFTASCRVSVEEAWEGITATGAGGYYFGDQYAIGSDNAWLILTTGDVTEADYSFSGEGVAVLFDLNMPKTGSPVISEGEYAALLEEPEGSQDFTFLPGTDMGGYGIIGSFIYKSEDGAAAPSYLMIEDGNIEIAQSGSEYEITASVTAGGEQYAFRYTGAVTLKDPSDGGSGGEDEYEQIEMTGLTQGEADFYGQAYGDTGTDYNNWTVYLASDEFDFQTFSGGGMMLQLEINTAGDATTEITPGIYTIFETIDPSSFVAFSAVPGFIQNQSAFGTWYIDDMSPIYGATSGTVEIGKSGDTYTLDFEFRDDEYKGIFRGSYSGKLSYYDGTAAYSPQPAVYSRRNAQRKYRLQALPETHSIRRMRFDK